MVRTEEWMDIQSLAAEGRSIRAIAEITGRSRNTVRRILRQRTPEPFRSSERTSKLEPFKPYVRERHEQFGLSAVRLFDEIRAQGYQGSIFTVRRYLHEFRARRKALAKATVRFETPPGEQAQADWTYLGRFPNAAGTLVSIYGFAMVLSFSRVLFSCFTTSMRTEVLIACHQQAFEYFGGSARTVLYDNMKQIRIEPGQWNPLFLDFAGYYGFSVKTHRVRRPRTKGKIERTIGYVKEGFLVGRSFADLDDLNAQARHWLDTHANVRVHGTTGKRPIDLLAREALLETGAMPPYRVSEHSVRTVDAEGYVHLERSRYSVPPEHVGKPVLVEHGGATIRVCIGDAIIAEHQRADRPRSTVADEAHVEAMWRMSLERPTRPLPRWEVRFDTAVATTPLAVYEEAAR